MSKGSLICFLLAVGLCAVACRYPTDGLAALSFWLGFGVLLGLMAWLSRKPEDADQPRSAIDINTVARAAPGDMPPSRQTSPSAAPGSGRRQPSEAA